MTEHKWVFTTHRVNPFRLEDGEKPYQDAWYESPHRMSWITRKDALVPRGGLIAYQAKCTCKWKDTRADSSPNWVPKRMLANRYNAHVVAMIERDKEYRQLQLGDRDA